MARVTIYVPDDLKARMDACGGEVNWSATAQTAFERAIAREVWKMSDDTMERAMARLRASKAEYEQQEREAGTAEGRKWALDRADYAELDRLSRYNGEMTCGALGAYMYDDTPPCPFWSESVFSIHEPYPQPSDFWVAGFVDSALAVFRELQAKL
jgi:hypothetical protein